MKKKFWIDFSKSCEKGYIQKKYRNSIKKEQIWPVRENTGNQETLNNF